MEGWEEAGAGGVAVRFLELAGLHRSILVTSKYIKGVKTFTRKRAAL